MPEGADWTGRWVAGRLEKHDQVQDVELLTSQVLRINRKDNPPFVACTIASPCVESETIEPFLDGSFPIAFLANIPQESFWTGGAIEFAASRSVAFGGMGDLMKAVNISNPHLYVNSEFEFVERGLRQHSKVTDLERIHDRMYVVKRHGLKDMAVILLNEYELTADHVRTARDRYGPFEAILLTNPNANPTSLARNASQSIGARIYKWAQFFGRLNRP